MGRAQHGRDPRRPARVGAVVERQGDAPAGRRLYGHEAVAARRQERPGVGERGGPIPGVRLGGRADRVRGEALNRQHHEDDECAEGGPSSALVWTLDSDRDIRPSPGSFLASPPEYMLCYNITKVAASWPMAFRITLLRRPTDRGPTRCSTTSRRPDGARHPGKISTGSAPLRRYPGRAEPSGCITWSIAARSQPFADAMAQRRRCPRSAKRK